MLKYEALGEALARLNASRVEMTFEEVERIVGKLPDSAEVQRPWWANDESHVQAAAWMGAGYKVESVDQAARHVVFAKR